MEAKTLTLEKKRSSVIGVIRELDKKYAGLGIGVPLSDVYNVAKKKKVSESTEQIREEIIKLERERKIAVREWNVELLS